MRSGKKKAVSESTKRQYKEGSLAKHIEATVARFIADAPKREARTEVYKAIKRGDILRPDACEKCGTVGRVEGHHPDYSKQLLVVWVCSRCHKAIHKALKESS